MDYGYDFLRLAALAVKYNIPVEVIDLGPLAPEDIEGLPTHDDWQDDGGEG